MCIDLLLHISFLLCRIWLPFFWNVLDRWSVLPSPDKENCSHMAHHSHLHHHHNSHHACCQQQTPPSQLPHDFAGFQSQGSSDIESLDDAASLANHMAVHSNKSSRVPTPECRPPNMELDSIDSSDFEENGIDSGFRPSSPESVFSACSGRSHATYRPKGHGSEAWVVAPPPCFTGSQISDAEPLASSPLENLLIEHPSMSVYYSVPSSALPSSHPLFSLPAIPDPLAVAGAAPEDESAVVTQEESSIVNANDEEVASLAIQPRRHPNQAALHSIQLCPEKLAEKAHTAQRQNLSLKQKAISNQKCHRQNLVQTYFSRPSSNRRNKLMRPSGCKSSRNSQRVHWCMWLGFLDS